MQILSLSLHALLAIFLMRKFFIAVETEHLFNPRILDILFQIMNCRETP